jgi:hypothetical protein
MTTSQAALCWRPSLFIARHITRTSSPQAGALKMKKAAKAAFFMDA